MSYHVPVLLNESVGGLDIQPDGVYLDLTFGGGGHSGEILKHLKQGMLFGFDQDADALQNVINDKRFHFVHSNFRFFTNFLRYYNIEKVDGILADLGVASHHFDEADRGFSFRYDALLDMRMNKASRINAGNVVNEYPQDELIRIFKSYGDFPGVHRLVSGIISARRSRPIRKTKELAKLVVELLKPKNENKILAQVFQALRIEVNGEMEVLKQMLHKSACSLNPGGRLVIITYHSVEDRLVKNYFKSGNFSGVKEADIYGRSDVPFEIVNRKVITPDEKEIQQNSRARSAKLRIAEKN